MNTEQRDLLLKVAKRIVENPNHFDMMSWFSYSPCGTTGCIAGWALSLAKGYELPDNCHACHSPGREAATLLGLTNECAIKLFIADRWPVEFRGRYLAAGYPELRAQVTAERIKHFIEKGE